MTEYARAEINLTADELPDGVYWAELLATVAAQSSGRTYRKLRVTAVRDRGIGVEVGAVFYDCSAQTHGALEHERYLVRASGSGAKLSRLGRRERHDSIQIDPHKHIDVVLPAFSRRLNCVWFSSGSSCVLTRLRVAPEECWSVQEGVDRQLESFSIDPQAITVFKPDRATRIHADTITVTFVNDTDEEAGTPAVVADFLSPDEEDNQP